MKKKDKLEMLRILDEMTPDQLRRLQLQIDRRLEGEE